MNRTKALLLGILAMLTVTARSQTINVHMTNGTVVNYPLADVNYIDFTAKENTPTPDPLPGTAPDGVVAVDLGLPSGTKWGNMNVGATKPEEYGLYFAWGETVGYTFDTTDGRSFTWTSYKWCNGSSNSLTKYCTSSSYGTVDNKTTLELADDAAHVNWGGSWVIPTVGEIEELLANTTSEWTSVNGVNGRRFTSKTNGNSVFLPAAGYRFETGVENPGSVGDYWSASLYEGGSYDVHRLNISSWNQDARFCRRDIGFPVRPVIRN